MPPYEDSEIPAPISKQLLGIRERLRDLQVNDATLEPNDARHRMKNPFEVLQKKELELGRVRQEVEALRLVTPLLAEDMEETETAPSSSTTQDATADRRKGWLPGKLLDPS